MLAGMALVMMAVAGGVIQAFNRVTGQEWDSRYQPGLLMVSVVIGFILALAQLPFFWRHFKSSILWFLVNIIGWLVLGLILGNSIYQSTDIIALGVIPAAFTVFGLIWLMHNPCTEPEHFP